MPPMDLSLSTLTTATIPGYFVNFTSESLPTSVQSNLSSKSSISNIASQTTGQSALNSMAAAPIGRGATGTWGVQGGAAPSGTGVAGTSVGTAGEDEDVFGEHYFHICIYIWVFVVVSSLIALSVKWGCCVRSLTRWEVKKIPLKKFQRTEGDECHDKCPICHESFHEGRLIRQLPCKHCYHSYCVDRWLVKMSNRCPLCKQRVSISLFCPWSKQRRNKEGSGGGGICGSRGQERLSMAELETEASIDESPPVPPLATLTPSSWYGEDIMLGPSKFVIMRPGHPTRVIDIREQNKTTKIVAGSRGDVEAAVEQLAAEGSRIHHRGEREACSHGCKDSSASLEATELCPRDSPGCNGPVSVLDAGSHYVCLSCHSRSRSQHHLIEQHQHHPSHSLVDELHKPSSTRSSRSCSVSSDQPLLGTCPICGELQVRSSDDDGRSSNSRCACQCQEERQQTTPSRIPSATTRLTASSELAGLEGQRDCYRAAVRHVQVVSLHNHHSFPCSTSQHQNVAGESSDSRSGKESSLRPCVARFHKQPSPSDETTVCLSSGSSSILTFGGDSAEPDCAPSSSSHRLSLPRHFIQNSGTLSTKSNTEVTSRSLNSLPSAWPSRGSPLISHTVIETPITYLGSEFATDESKARKPNKSRPEDQKCSSESVAAVSCDQLHSDTLISPMSPQTSPVGENFDSHKFAVEVELKRLGPHSVTTDSKVQEAWHGHQKFDSSCFLTTPTISSCISSPTPHSDPVLTILPSSTGLFPEQSSPPRRQRRTRRRSNDFTCKHL